MKWLVLKKGRSNTAWSRRAYCPCYPVAAARGSSLTLGRTDQDDQPVEIRPSMTVSVCPTASVNASAEQVWRLLSDPARYSLWWDATTQSILPAGPATPGQLIHAHSQALGKKWAVRIKVEAVEHGQRQLKLTTMLPFGITVYNQITCTPIDSEHCRVVFG